VSHVGDLTATALIANARQWSAPQPLAIGAVANPFARDVDREVRLLERKLAAGAEFIQSQMVFDLGLLREFLERTADLLIGLRFLASIALLRSGRMAGRARRLPGCLLPASAYRQISLGGGLELAAELATQLAAIEGVGALHIYPLGAEEATREVASSF